MRLVCVHPGATWATHDVHTGLLAGLRANGHEVREFSLGARLHESRVTLEYRWRRHVRGDGPLKDVRPTAGDVQYLAGQALVPFALRHEPDWLLVVCAAYLHPDILILCRRAGLRLAAVFTESPYDDAEQAKLAPLFDVCFTNERASVPVLRDANPQTHYLPAAYDPAAHGSTLNGAAQAHDVVFVGTAFDSRLALLAEVDWTGIDLGLYGHWDGLGDRHPLRPFVRQGLVDNARAGALYRAARIGLNLYRGTGGAPAESLNPRAYELAADGLFTLSQPRAEVFEKFGALVPTFETAHELTSMLRHFLKNCSARRIGAAHLAPTVAEDSYTHRAAQVVACLTDAA